MPGHRKQDSNTPADSSLSDLLGDRKIDAAALEETMRRAFDEFNARSRTLTRAYQGLKKEIARVNLELERKNTQLSEKNRELDRANEFLDSLFEGMTNALCVLDRRQRILKVNGALKRLVGKNDAELSGKRLSEIPELEPLSRFAANARKADPGERHRGCTIPLPGGRKWLELTGSLIPGGERFVLEIRDLTELKDLRNRLVQSATLAGLGQMSVTVAHEIRNPLGGIEGFASLLKRDLADNPSHAKLLEKIIEGVQNLNRFIGCLLDFSKPLKVRARPVLLKNLIEKSIQYSGKHDGADQYREIRIERRIASGCEVVSDPELIQQVVLNLLLNAYQAMNGSGRVRIHVSMKKKGRIARHPGSRVVESVRYESARRHVLISVADSGPGIDVGTLETIFQPFFTTRAFGTGIGLATVHKIVEGLEGRIDVIPAGSLGGAEFRIYLPGLDR
jgi:PAS domain S-box-containing protein